MPVALGIDLGLTYSCIASIQGKNEVIANSGHHTTPSCVAFVYGDEKEPAAEAQFHQEANSTSRHAKKRMDRSYSELSELKGLKRWSIKRANSSGGPTMPVSYQRQKKRFSSQQEVAAMIFRKLKAHAEDLLGDEVTATVISFPGYFTDSEIRATREAGELAGLKVMRVIPEPTAAALSYGLDRKIAGDKQVLIFDLGGGTTNVAVVSWSGGRAVVRGLEGNSHVGRNELDELVGKYSVEGGKHRPRVCGACVERLLSEASPGKYICGTVQPAEAVAYGAALWAAHLSKHETAHRLRGLRERAMTPVTVGIKVGMGVFQVLIPRNTVIPVRKEVRLKTNLNRRRSVCVRVYQGERPVVKHNNFVGELLLQNLPSSRAGLGVDVALCIDGGGTLSVEAKAETSTKWKGCTLQLDDRSTAEILSNLEDAERCREQDQREVERLWRRLELQKYLINNVKEVPDEAKAAFIATRKWFDENPNAVIDEITMELENLKTHVSRATMIKT